MNTVLFLTVRALHVLVAAVWLGAASFVAFFLMPALAQVGPPGGPVMAAIARRGFIPFVAIVSGTTVVTGLWLFWRFTGGFDPALSRTHAGLAFGIGGAAGFAAAIVANAVVARGSKRMLALGAHAASLADGPERAALVQSIATLRRRVLRASRIVVALQAIAASLMAIGHYI